jgi:hypothetical protein
MGEIHGRRKFDQRFLKLEDDVRRLRDRVRDNLGGGASESIPLTDVQTGVTYGGSQQPRATKIAGDAILLEGLLIANNLSIPITFNQSLLILPEGWTPPESRIIPAVARNLTNYEAGVLLILNEDMGSAVKWYGTFNTNYINLDGVVFRAG